MPKFLLGRRQFALGAAAAATTALIPKGNGLAIDALAQAARPVPSRSILNLLKPRRKPPWPSFPPPPRPKWK